MIFFASGAKGRWFESTRAYHSKSSPLFRLPSLPLPQRRFRQCAHFFAHPEPRAPSPSPRARSPGSDERAAVWRRSRCAPRSSPRVYGSKCHAHRVRHVSPEGVERQPLDARQLARLTLLFHQRRLFHGPALGGRRKDPLRSRNRLPHIEQGRRAIRQRNGPPPVRGFPERDMQGVVDRYQATPSPRPATGTGLIGCSLRTTGRMPSSACWWASKMPSPTCCAAFRYAAASVRQDPNRSGACPTFGFSRACPLPSYAERRRPGLPSVDRVPTGAGG